MLEKLNMHIVPEGDERNIFQTRENVALHSKHLYTYIIYAHTRR